IVIAADPIRFFIPYHGYSVKATAKSIPNTSFQLLSEQYEIHANTYNQFRRMYQRAYIRQGFIPIAFTANITPLAAYRANFINEAQFTHAPEQQARAADERATYSTAVEAHIGLALRNHMPYVSFLHLRSGFKTENSAQIDWKTGLSNGS